VLPGDACQFTNIEDFIDVESLTKMKKVKAKGTCKKFQAWLSIAKKAKKVEEAFCCRHLKKCPSSIVQVQDNSTIDVLLI
jgi:hypothetical protein